ncbi:ribbon-helix-helix domain-containing protein [Francisellaceae bacterium]|nr:ribbon-helix-helix domain-containing protein [Francisellaceae bacterium]
MKAKVLKLNDGLVSDIERYKNEYNFATTSEAIRSLIQSGLESNDRAKTNQLLTTLVKGVAENRYLAENIFMRGWDIKSSESGNPANDLAEIKEKANRFLSKVKDNIKG